MKKIIALIVCICLICCLVGCGLNKGVTATENNDYRIKTIYNNGTIKVYVDVETGCQYIARIDSGICLMVDENGKPLIYEEVGVEN